MDERNEFDDVEGQNAPQSELNNEPEGEIEERHDLQPEPQELQVEVKRERDSRPVRVHRILTLMWWYGILAHAIGPALSIAIHMLFFTTVFVAGIKVEKEVVLDHSEVTVKIEEISTKMVEQPPEPPKPEEEEQQEEEEAESEEVELEFDYAATTDIVLDSLAAYSGNQGSADVVIDPIGVQVEMPNLATVKPGDAESSVPGVYANRGGKGRNSAIGKFGGAGTSNPVLKALRWLKANQNNNGSWGNAAGDVNVAMTGLALMCFLAHGEVPQSNEFGPTVQAAIEWLAGYYFIEPKKSGHEGYSHAIATYAIAEAYGMTQIPIIKKSMNFGIKRMIKGMNSVGGYTYMYGVDGRSDLSVSAWNYQAMKAAYAAGCDVEGLDEAMGKAVTCLKSVLFVPGKEPHRGAFAYAVMANDAASKPGSHAMLGAGTLCLQLLGEGGSQEALAGYETIKSSIAPGKLWISYGADHGSSGPYAWYYLTQAIFQASMGTGAAWDKWNKQMKTALIGVQYSDGHWEKPKHESHGGDGIDGQIYATTLNCLTLEVYYRFLPSFRSSGAVIDGKAAGKGGKGGAKDTKAKAKTPDAGKGGKLEDDIGLRILDGGQTQDSPGK